MLISRTAASTAVDTTSRNGATRALPPPVAAATSFGSSAAPFSLPEFATHTPGPTSTLQAGPHARIEGLKAWLQESFAAHLNRKAGMLEPMAERMYRQSRRMDTREIGNTLVRYGRARTTANNTFVIAWDDWSSVYQSTHWNMRVTLAEDDAPHSACTYHLQQCNRMMFCDNRQLLGAKVVKRQELRWDQRGR